MTLWGEEKGRTQHNPLWKGRVDMLTAWGTGDGERQKSRRVTADKRRDLLCIIQGAEAHFLPEARPFSETFHTFPPLHFLLSSLVSCHLILLHPPAFWSYFCPFPNVSTPCLPPPHINTPLFFTTTPLFTSLHASLYTSALQRKTKCDKQTHKRERMLSPLSPIHSCSPLCVSCPMTPSLPLPCRLLQTLLVGLYDKPCTTKEQALLLQQMIY